MKRVIFGCIMTLGIFAASCSSENKQEQMYDSSVNADTGFIDADTSGVMDTTNSDSVMDKNTPASTGSSGRESSPTQH